MISNIRDPLPSRDNVSIDKTPLKEQKISKSSTLASSVNFPDAASTTNLNFTTKKAETEEPLLQELEQLLGTQANQIEKEFKEAEKLEPYKGLVDAVFETESWGSEAINTVNERVFGGVEFLGNVFPRKLLDRIPAYKKLEHLGEISSLGITFLSALDFGSQGLALICKMKILEQAKELLKQVKAADEQHSSKVEETNREGPLSTDEQEKTQIKIREWELQIELEEKALEEEKLQFKLDTTSNVLSLLNVPLSYLPKGMILDRLKLVATSGISCITSALGMLIMWRGLKQTTEETHELQHWMAAYQEWQEHYQPQFQQTEKGLKREQVTSLHPPAILTADKHENVLFEWIEKAKSLAQIERKLKDLAMTLPPSITSKKELLTYLKTNPDYRMQLVGKYIAFQRKLEAHNVIIQTSADLWKKRIAIVKKKVLLLKPHFQTVEDKIQELKKPAFVKDMQQFLWKTLQDPGWTSKEIEEQFHRWGLFDPAMAVQNQRLLAAFQSLKNAEQHKFMQSKISSMPLKLKQHFIQELSQWMNHPTAMDQQFKHWFGAQNQESLLEFYVDHQETLEHTTKNALKQMVQQKHGLESRFNHFKLTESRVQFSVAAVTLAISATLAVLGLLTVPVGGAGIILLYLSAGSFAISMGFLGASHYHSRYYKPQTTQTLTYLFQTKMVWTKLRTSIQTYSHQAKEKKLLEVAQILKKLHPSIHSREQPASVEYQKALAEFKKAKLDFEQSQQKVKEWSERLKELETHLAKKGWEDFAQYAALQIAENPTAFDTLRAFQEAFQACDLRLLSAETKTLLELQLGVNLETLQAQIKQEPQAIQKTMQDFFILEDSGLIAFIKNQKARIKKGLLKPQTT